MTSAVPETATDTSLDVAIKRAEAVCRENGVRFTQQRQLVYRLILSAEKPIGAYELLDAMKNEVSGVAPPTVYRALDFLLEQGLIHKLESLHAYIGCREPDHVHDGQFLICSRCGHAEEIDDRNIAGSLEGAMQSHGFQGNHQVVEVMGRCADCRSDD